MRRKARLSERRHGVYDPRNKRRKFNGRLLTQYGTTYTKKRDATNSSEYLRKQGFNVRVVPFQAPKIYGRKKFYSLYYTERRKRKK